jgi:uncharacterized protein (TIGR02453 family)
MGEFEGFADGEGRFFKALAKNQKREWFLAHKDEFERGWNAPMKLLLADVRAKIDRAYPHCDLDAPKTFRIFRDVRFSKDKSPYKTNVSGILSIKRAGTAPSVPAALYLQLGTETMAAAGHYVMSPPELARFRAAVADDTRGKALAKLIATLRKKGYATRAPEVLKRVPKGFDPEHARAELLKMKGLIVTFPAIPKKLLTSAKLAPWLVNCAKDAAPLVEWLTFATA